MDIAAKAKKSQALIDSIEELIALEADVSLATEKCHTAQEVMVPLTEVAFMPGTFASDRVMVGLGEDYFVERTPQEARTIFQRRMTDLSEQVRSLAEGALLVPEPPPRQPARPSRKKKSDAGSKSTWAKGFLSTGLDTPGPGCRSRKGEKAPTDTKGRGETPDKYSSPIPTEVTYNDAEGYEHVVEVEDGEEDPIVEIREWLDESGNQTSVDVTNLGKILGTMPKVVEADLQSAVSDADISRPKNVPKNVSTASPAEHNSVRRRQPSDLNSVLARLEEQEAEAKKQASSPSLGPNWKKGFLDGGAKRSTQEPSAATTSGARVLERVKETGPAVPTSAGAAKAKPQAFRPAVIEKPNAGATPLLESTTTTTAAHVAPARVSRFKAQRRGL